MKISIKYKDNTIEDVFLDTPEEVMECIKVFNSVTTNNRFIFLDTKAQALLVALDDVRRVQYIPQEN